MTTIIMHVLLEASLLLGLLRLPRTAEVINFNRVLNLYSA